MPRAGDVVAGKYRVDSLIGEGGMGAVFAATHTLTGKRVALKWMLPELAADEGAVQRFMREAQAAGRIDHPNVVDIYDVGEHEGSTFLVMEYLVGETLTAALERGRLDVPRVVQVLIPAMRGVAAAHKMGVIHRDLKPDNIFLCLDPDGSYRDPKVLDFGISKVSSSDGQQHNPRLTRTGAVMGTPYYMSPEQIRGLAEVDHRTDVYAFGVILYETLTGRVPFDADTYSALILEIATGTPRRLRAIRPELPQALEDIVMRAIAREMRDRYPDVESLARALEPFAAGVMFSSERPDPTGGARSTFATTTPFGADGPVRLPVRRASLGIIAVAGVAAVGLGVWALSAARTPDGGAGEGEEGAEHIVSGPQPTAAAQQVPAPELPTANPPGAPTALPDAGVAKPEAAPGLAAPAAPESARPTPTATEPGRKKPAADPGANDPTRSGRKGRTGSLRTDEF